jgi:hypothetical protein
MLPIQSYSKEYLSTVMATQHLKLHEGSAVFPPRNYFVHIVICRDSFDYFQGLKAQLSQLGYRYYLTPLGDGDFVETGSGPTSSQ